MDRMIIAQLQKTFEEHARKADGVEFWLARELQLLLGYDKWENFYHVIEKAKVAKVARLKLESKTKRKIISKENYIPERQKRVERNNT